ncbi:MAG: hypothetical protein C5B50_15960 [Verrucomicrobia bacterium]|nr:MAG: hypothetical protein C5B50_15960 [Verrucomicrobiota bacterium]
MRGLPDLVPANKFSRFCPSPFREYATGWANKPDPSHAQRQRGSPRNFDGLSFSTKAASALGSEMSEIFLLQPFDNPPALRDCP